MLCIAKQDWNLKVHESELQYTIAEQMQAVECMHIYVCTCKLNAQTERKQTVQMYLRALSAGRYTAYLHR